MTAAFIAVIVVLAAGICRLVAPATFTAVDYAPYDAWLKWRRPIPASPSLVLIIRDGASEARFGAEAWDHALFARVITALGRAGATVVGLDVRMGGSSPQGRGGAASDAMLTESTRIMGRAVYPMAVRFADEPGTNETLIAPMALHRSWPILKGTQTLHPVLLTGGPRPSLAQHAVGLGHAMILPDNDGVIRRVPLYVRVDDRALPAFGMALLTSFVQAAPEQISIKPGRAVIVHAARLPDGQARRVSIPIDGEGHMLINYTGREIRPAFPSVSFLDVWRAIETGEPEKLREWVAGKIVLLLPGERSRASQQTPHNRYHTEDFIQANILNTLLIEEWMREAPPVTAIVAALALAGLTAWLLLTAGGWAGVIGVIGVALGYLVLIVSALWSGNTILPVSLPLLSLAFASGGTTLWMHLMTDQRIRLLEQHIQRVQHELAASREALVCRESVVEGLEEDLEVARTAVARSAGKEQELVEATETLRTQLEEAQAHEDTTRRRFQELERELFGLREANTQMDELGDAEQEQLRQECEQMEIISRDPSILSVFRDLKKGARTPLTVLILGEPGTGKELFARAVHGLSPRADGPFVPVNMAAISPELFESELFGHVKGSFTGALTDRKGYFEQAHHGTIFLDEIGDLRLDHQGKLLRVLQNRTFHRVGDTKLTTIDVRIVAATNKDPQRGVAEGWFREDLYFRLKGLVLRLPPLRDRRDDIPALAERFVRAAAAQIGRARVALSQEAVAMLVGYLWRGNIRELQYCLDQAVALAEGPVITKADLRLAPVVQPTDEGREDVASADATGDRAVLACLRNHEFDMQATAQALGWDRSTVTQRLKGMSFRALVETKGDQRQAALILAGDPTFARTVELKLREYYEHLIKTIHEFKTPEEAIAASKKRFKNLPERHFKAVEILISQYFST